MSAFRSAARLPARLGARPSIPAVAVRSLQFSARRLATSEDNNDPLANLKIDEQSPMMQNMFAKIREHEGARKAVEDLMAKLQEAGLDPAAPPSKMAMLKLFAKKDVREGFSKLMEEMRNAGIDLNPENMSQLFQGGGPNNEKK